MLILLSNGSRGLVRTSRSPYQRPIFFLALLVICLSSIYLSTCFLPSILSSNRLASTLLAPSKSHGRAPFKWKEPPKRLIVFGDSTCDNGQYPIDPPPEDEVMPQDTARGQVWTDWLCAAVRHTLHNVSLRENAEMYLQFSCVHHDNFARPPKSSSSSSSTSPSLSSALSSHFSSPPFGLREAVIDSSLLNSTWMVQHRLNHDSMISKLDIEDPVADLRAQVQHWLAFEKTQLGTPRSTAADKHSTVFSLSFSTWELWYYSAGVYSNAQVAVTKSMDSLFEQLDLIAENWTSDLKIVLFNAIDPTFLPLWHGLRTGPYGADSFSEDQRNAVLLVEQWNLALEKRARRWKKGVIYIYDINSWLLEQIRQGQLQNKKWKEANGVVTPQTAWENVETSCLGSTDHPSDQMQGSQSDQECPHPSLYLFR